MDKGNRSLEMLKLLEEKGYTLSDVRKLLEKITRIDMEEVELIQEKADKPEERTRNDMEIIISDLLRNIGIPPQLSGYKYSKTAILIAYYDVTVEDMKMKNLYPKVAAIYKTFPNRVQRDIRHSVKTVFERGNIDVIESIFGYRLSQMKGKATNSEFIATISEYLRMKYPLEEMSQN